MKTALLAAALSLSGGMAMADCFTVPEPVVSLSYGSRYVADDASRSEIDNAANAAVNDALKPIDAFIVDLVRESNKVLDGSEDAEAAADCVIRSLFVWAETNALSELKTMNAQISVPGRYAGLAFAYSQAAPLSGLTAEKAAIEAWLTERANAMVTFFDAADPPRATRNNLRAWAGLAAARIGLSTRDDTLLRWAGYTTALVACQANPDGSLPLEMRRGKYALHYQLHAVAPLVVTAALLQSRDVDLFADCDEAILRSARFVAQAFADPSVMEAINDTPQTFFDGSDTLKAHDLAWAEALLVFHNIPEVAELAAPFHPLANSKLGGTQSLIWQKPAN